MKRRLMLVLLLLVAGAIVNVAVTAALWLWGERPLQGTFEAIDYWHSRPCTAAAAAAWHRLAGDEWPSPPDKSLAQSKFGMRFASTIRAVNEFDLSGLTTAAEWQQKAKDRSFFSVESTACGWPLIVATVSEAQVTKGVPP